MSVNSGKGSDAIAAAIERTEERVKCLGDEVSWLRTAHEQKFQPPPEAWIEDRLRDVRSLLDRNVSDAGLALREYLGTIKLEPVTPDVGRPYLVARMSLGLLDLLADPPRASDESEGEPGGRVNFGPRRPRRARNPRLRTSFDTGDPCSTALRLRALKDSNL